MAFFDDRRFLLSHINHSFITGDDTGICEVVMLDEEVFENQHQQCLKLIGSDENDPEKRLDQQAFDLPYQTELLESEQGQSYDIASELDYISHRRRSNTAQRLDRLTKEKKDQSKTRTIVWRCPSPDNNNLNEEKLDDEPDTAGFSKDTSYSTKQDEVSIPHSKSKSPPAKSGLTRLLERFPSLPKNPFDVYAQYDGGMSESMPVKRIMIFIALNQPQPQQPHEVVVLSSATIRDLIGLICWQYTNESREPKLNCDIDRYCLRIAEDNGEVDPDFPSLNPNEQLSKFNFPMLAFAEKPAFNDQYPNGSNFNQQIPNYAQSVVTKSNKSSKVGRLAAFTRIIFKDAKLEISPQ